MATPQVTFTQAPSRVEPHRWAWTQRRPVWASLAIVAMWIAVLFAAVYGSDFVTTSSAAGVASDRTTVPSVIPVALFACIATIIVARYGFRSDEQDSPTDTR